MDKETQAIKGWRSFKFRFGSQAQFDDPIDQYKAIENMANMEQIGYGCFHSVVDYDELDSN